MPIFAEKNVPSREKRCSALSAYQGTIRSLLDEFAAAEGQQNIRTFTQANPDDILAALSLLCTIRDAVVVVHGAIGCGAACLDLCRGNSSTWYSTALDEKDTILGGDAKLRDTITRAYHEQRPKVIFIVSTPVVAINNDDINSAIFELEGELDCKIISVVTDGFKSKTAVNGIDVALHSIGKHLIGVGLKSRECIDAGLKAGEFINLIAVDENRRSVDSLISLIRSILPDKFGVNVIPKFATSAQIACAGSARANIAINDSRADVFLKGLEEKTGVVSLRSRTPIGIKATSEWLLSVGALLGREDIAQRVAETQCEQFAELFAKKPMTGKSVFVALPAKEATETALFLTELGADVMGISVDSADDTNTESLSRLPVDTPVYVGNGQPFELANVFRKKSPFFFITGYGNIAWAAEAGAFPVSVEKQIRYGYEGAAELLRSLRHAEARPVFAGTLHVAPRRLYKDTWFKRSANWYVKREVT
jgi:nitrogenase molybdenum-iron protein alpha chain